MLCRRKEFSVPKSDYLLNIRGKRSGKSNQLDFKKGTNKVWLKSRRRIRKKMLRR